MKNQKED